MGSAPQTVHLQWTVTTEGAPQTIHLQCVVPARQCPQTVHLQWAVQSRQYPQAVHFQWAVPSSADTLCNVNRHEDNIVTWTYLQPSLCTANVWRLNLAAASVQLFAAIIVCSLSAALLIDNFDFIDLDLYMHMSIFLLLLHSVMKLFSNKLAQLFITDWSIFGLYFPLLSNYLGHR